MTDRQVTESSIGLAGRLTHLPYGLGKAEDRGWKSTRNFTQNVHVFKELGPHKTWFPVAGTTGIPSLGSSASSAWQAKRKQQRWLLKAHPEARLGNECVHDQFLSSQSYLESDERARRGSSLFAIGEITDTSDRQGVSSRPLIAITTGEANDVLRLTIPSVEEWQWRNDDSVSLRLMDVTEKDESVFYEDEMVGPIRRLKSVVDPKRYGPTRWIIMQRDCGTRVLQPEYRRAPIQYHEGRPSHIAPNPLFFLSKDRTGDNPHSDASFNPGVRSKPPQLGLIDECGFWSIWDITHTKNKSSKPPKVSLRSCGHIEKGILDHLPSRGAEKAQWHKILWVGCPGDSENSPAFDFEEDEDTTKAQTPFTQPMRSSTLLVCSPQLVRVLDLANNSFLPDLPLVGDPGLDCILDVHENSQDAQYIFVLTMWKLFMVRVYSSSGRDRGEARKQWTVVLAIPHLRDCFDRSLKLAVSPGPRSSDQATSLVSLYSSSNVQVDLFCVTMLKSDPFSVTYHRESIIPNILQRASPDTVPQTMCLHTAPTAVRASESPTPSARSLIGQQVRFYQFITLKADMCLASTLSVATFTLPIDHINRPDRRIYRPRDPSRERRKVMKHIAPRFVVPDTVTTPGTQNGQARSTVKTLPQWPITRRPIGIFYEHIRAVFSNKTNENQQLPAGEEIFGSNPFDFVHLAIEQAIKNATMPATTLFQIIKNFRVPSNMDLAATEWEHEIEGLGRINPDVPLLALSRPQSQVTKLSSLQELYSAVLAIMTSTNLISDRQVWMHETRVVLCRQMACDVYLSLFGLVHRKVDVAESQHSLAHDLENMMIDSQQVSRAGSSSRAQSEIPVPSSRASTMEPPQEDPAMALLRSYTGAGKFVPPKRTELLDKWELGVGPGNYVFDLDRSKEVTPGMQKRAKQLARQDRKRRRAETLLQMQSDKEPSLPATQPPQDTRSFSQFTQPVGRGFSQSQAIMSDPLQTMTQPMAGAFGRRDERPKKKMKKRKGGF